MFKKYFILLLFFLVFLSFNSNFSNSNLFYYPTDYLTITSNYGNREVYGVKNFHNGTDFGAPQNSEVYSISSGVITYAGFLNGYGNTVIIKHNNGITSLYAHLSENFIVSPGDNISSHELIGFVGPKYLSNGILNGFTTGPHLHITIFDKNNYTINPLSLKFEIKKKR